MRSAFRAVGGLRLSRAARHRGVRSQSSWVQRLLSTQQADPTLAVGDPELLKLVLAAATQALAEQLKADGGLHRAFERLLRFLDPAELPGILVNAVRDPIGTFRDLLSRQSDPNDYRIGADEGVYEVPLATRTGARNSPREFLLRTQEEVKDRLNIVYQALATEIVLDDQNRSTGVRYLKGASLYRADERWQQAASPPQECFARARREVIVCGGAFNTPQLLMLSGIGPKADLEKMKIPVKVPLEGVGKNLQDRYEIGVICQMKEKFALLSGCGLKATDPPDRCLKEWQEQRRGVYTTNGAVLGVIRRSRPDLVDPDLFLFGLPGTFKGYYVGYSDDIVVQPDVFTWAILKGHTGNRAGQVTLRSADPRDVPDINFHYFDEGTHDQGQDKRRSGGPRAGRPLRPRHHGPGRAGQQGHEDGTAARPAPTMTGNCENSSTARAWGHHACGTCKIGADGDAAAVLDSRFRVRNTRGLRVVDASVFPKIPGFFIVTPIYMISEKASDVILEDARRSEGT